MTTNRRHRATLVTLAILLAFASLCLSACGRTTFSLPYGNRPATVSITQPVGK